MPHLLRTIFAKDTAHPNNRNCLYQFHQTKGIRNNSTVSIDSLLNDEKHELCHLFVMFVILLTSFLQNLSIAQERLELSRFFNPQGLSLLRLPFRHCAKQWV